MKILVNGPTGTKISLAIEKLKKYFMQEEGISVKHIDSILKIYSFEDELESISGTSLTAYLDRDDFIFQETKFEETFKSILVKIHQDKAEHSILTMNYPYFRDDKVLPAMNFELLKNLSPAVIITIIDDAFACWSRIKKKREEKDDRSYFSLRDMFSWRSTSILFGDTFAKNLNIKNFVVAVKHPPSMLYKLIFKSDTIIKIYSSYPISSVKKNLNDRQVIDDFRTKLHEKFCVFDPITIDDRRIGLDASGNVIPITPQSRWPLASDFSMVSEDDIWESESEIILPLDQVKQVSKGMSNEDKSIIDRHILVRDYRLISDSQVVVVGRPFYKKNHSMGVASEISYAVNVAGKKCFLWWNPSEDGEQKDSPFVGKGHYETDLDNIIDSLLTNQSDYLRI